jgi:hypothetical protein
MLSLGAYKIADLQQALGILQAAQGAGMSLDDLSAELGSAIDQVVAAKPLPKPLPDHQDPQPLCPRCGRGVMEYWPHSSVQAGEAIFGCRSCQYSRRGGAAHNG